MQAPRVHKIQIFGSEITAEQAQYATDHPVSDVGTLSDLGGGSGEDGETVAPDDNAAVVISTVAQDGTGDYTKIQDAINAIPEGSRGIIYIRPGVYEENVYAGRKSTKNKYFSLIGEDKQTTILTSGVSRGKGNEDNTYNDCAALNVYASRFYAENLTIRNTSGNVGQAEAMFVSGNRAVFNNCRFKGFQDTLYTYGKQSKQLYKNCYIEGTVDFIFGSSTAYFLNCKIHCLRNGYITAASTPENVKYGYVFRYCTITAEKEVTGGVFLGRPWRPYAKTVFIECTMGKFINSEGWNNWGSTEKEKTVTYGEADSYDFDGNIIDLSKRVAWAKIVNPDDYAIEKVLADNDKPEWYK